MKLARSLSLFLLFSISIACSSNPPPQTSPPELEEPPPEPIVLKVRPEVCIAPCTISIEWRIPRHPDNRRYAIVLKEESLEISRHEKSMDGKHEQAVFSPMYIEYLGNGDYSVEAILTRTEQGKEKEYRSVKKVRVAGASDP